MAMFVVGPACYLLWLAYTELPARLSRTRLAPPAYPHTILGVLASVSFAVLLAAARGGGVAAPRGFCGIVSDLLTGAIVVANVSTASALLAGRYFFGTATVERSSQPDKGMVLASRVTLIVLAVGGLVTQCIDWGFLDGGDL